MNWSRRIAVVLCTLSVVYCANPQSGAPNASCLDFGGDDGRAHAVYYQLGWNDDGIVDQVDGGWTAITDLGYRVRVDQGALVNYSAQLIECQQSEMNRCDTASLTTTWSRAFLPGNAWAGHGSGESDSSAIERVHIQSLTGTVPIDYGAAMAEPASYCRSHYLAGPGPATADDVRSGSLLGNTLWLEGSYTAPGSTESVAFRLATTSAYGMFSDLTRDVGDSVSFDSGHASALVVISRARGRMFDGIDLAQASAKEAAKQALANLVLSTSARIYLKPD